MAAIVHQAWLVGLLGIVGGTVDGRNPANHLGCTKFRSLTSDNMDS